ncbi:radical SAM family heme chaperone HemW [Tetragenococcus halophilus]|uniref:radical SAM family heme chaperone HemW n=1 Tax=Tetragenococcus halophilus TaxID=51669 RepID=UPI001F31BD32|nr:radical SAM family heme chaperone HemW [Tetragenococcus halophilus]MCF1600784.1 radical SAM family heme chaperone HemW [Tetragenococcus halophilus]MDN6710479.1 radical SAM family heme chaperone HemW [Tetragenococcus halophilus]MDN6725988.1 radical SAM family heme chaperone HemW [Tetragenococcus halophilus]
MEKVLQNTSSYIHIPFCEHICFYCNFNKVFLKGQPVDEYIQGLLKEIQLTLDLHPTDASQTIYIGGGTPTCLSAKQLDDLLSGITQLLPVETTKEFTIEANPGDLTQEKLNVIKNYGINRLSMGVQTFDNRLLRRIGRKHTAEDVYQTLKLIEKNQIDNLSIDLIYALPAQSIADFLITLEKAIALDLPHYAIYSLILENKTMFMNWVRRGRIELPEQEEEAKMFELAINEMEKAGFSHYEVSNFAKKGWESKHNLVYWNNEHYYGFGAGASSYLNQQRYKNFGPIQHYLNPLRNNQLPIIETENLSFKNQIEEELFLGLRKKEGVSLHRFKEKFNLELTDLYQEVLPELFDAQLLTFKNDHLKLTRKGLFLGNEVFEKFLLS